MKKMILMTLLPLSMLAAEPQLNTLPLKDNFYTVEVSPQLKSYAMGEKFKINPSEMITVSFKSKAICAPKQYGKIMAGFRQFTEEGRRIYSAHVNYVKGSDAVLAADAAKGSKTITVKNPVWKLNTKESVAYNGVEESKFDVAKALRLQTIVVLFQTKPDHKDIPNFTVDSSSNLIVKVIPQEDDTVTVELKKPLKNAFKAGTNVRLHLWSNESEYAYSCWPYPGLQTYKFSQSPKKWLPGAKSAQLFFSFSCSSAFKNLKLEMEKPLVKKIAEDGELF